MATERRKMKKRASAALNSFVKGECANYDNSEKRCVFDYKCKILAGKRCAYFERAVLGPPDYKYRRSGYNYKKIFKQYSQIRKELRGELHKVNVNSCAICGEAIPPNFTYCERCGKIQKRNAQRDRVRRHRCNASVSKKEELM